MHSIENGAKSVEYAHMSTRETTEPFKENGVWLMQFHLFKRIIAVFGFINLIAIPFEHETP